MDLTKNKIEVSLGSKWIKILGKDNIFELLQKGYLQRTQKEEQIQVKFVHDQVLSWNNISIEFFQSVHEAHFQHSKRRTVKFRSVQCKKYTLPCITGKARVSHKVKQKQQFPPLKLQHQNL